MTGIDLGKSFLPLNIAVVTVSDTRTAENDASGDAIAFRVVAAGHKISGRTIVPDTVARIRAEVSRWIADPEIDVIITTGGTGLTGRDVTIEAVTPLFEKTVDGFSTIFHMISHRTVGLSTLQSRATAGLVNGVVIFCLPGSPGAVKDAWDGIIVHQLDSRYAPCNLAELSSRFRET